MRSVSSNAGHASDCPKRGARRRDRLRGHDGDQARLARQGNASISGRVVLTEGRECLVLVAQELGGRKSHPGRRSSVRSHPCLSTPTARERAGFVSAGMFRQRGLAAVDHLVEPPEPPRDGDRLGCGCGRRRRRVAHGLRWRERRADVRQREDPQKEAEALDDARPQLRVDGEPVPPAPAAYGVESFPEARVFCGGGLEFERDAQLGQPLAQRPVGGRADNAVAGRLPGPGGQGRRPRGQPSLAIRIAAAGSTSAISRSIRSGSSVQRSTSKSVIQRAGDIRCSSIDVPAHHVPVGLLPERLLASNR